MLIRSMWGAPARAAQSSASRAWRQPAAGRSAPHPPRRPLPAPRAPTAWPAARTARAPSPSERRRGPRARVGPRDAGMSRAEVSHAVLCSGGSPATAVAPSRGRPLRRPPEPGRDRESPRRPTFSSAVVGGRAICAPRGGLPAAGGKRRLELGGPRAPRAPATAPPGAGDARARRGVGQIRP